MITVSHAKRKVRRRKYVFLLSVFLLGTLLFTGCGRKDLSVSDAGFYFDTIISIRLYGTDDSKPIQGCFELASRYENMFSNTIADSDISRINEAAAGGGWTAVSPETLELLQRGIRYGDISHGSFDITIGALSDLWNFSEISANLTSENNETDASVLPDPEQVAEALASVDYHAVEIDGDKVRLTTPDAKLDLGGIAKGYIADRMKDYLIEQNVTSAIINLGGNVVVVGSKPDGSAYSVGIQKPFEENAVIGVISVKDKSCVTSGVYERYYRINGKLYHHILDLSDGYPCENDLYSVTIITDSSMDADALSTTCYALGAEKGMELIEATDNVEAVFVTSDMKCRLSSGIGKKLSFRQE